MTKSEDEIINDWRRMDNTCVNEMCELIKKREIRVHEYLADIVASICEIDTAVMMTKDSRLHGNHARWLYWYAYRYMTNDTYEQIANVTERYGRRYSYQGINAAVNKMAELISRNTVWTNRWSVLKRIIKAREKAKELDLFTDTHIDEKIIINVPKKLKDNIEINYTN